VYIYWSVVIYYVIVLFEMVNNIHFLYVIIFLNWGGDSKEGFKKDVSSVLVSESVGYIRQSFKTDVTYKMLALHRKVILQHDQTWCLVTAHHGLTSKGH